MLQSNIVSLYHLFIASKLPLVNFKELEHNSSILSMLIMKESIIRYFLSNTASRIVYFLISCRTLDTNDNGDRNGCDDAKNGKYEHNNSYNAYEFPK